MVHLVISFLVVWFYCLSAIWGVGRDYSWFVGPRRLRVLYQGMVGNQKRALAIWDPHSKSAGDLPRWLLKNSPGKAGQLLYCIVRVFSLIFTHYPPRARER